MADIRVERKTGGVGNWWIWALVAAAIVLLLLALFGWWNRPGEQVGLVEPGAAGAITYEGEAWIPAGNRVEFPDEQMVAVGETEEGYTLFANREQGYQEGGGAGEITPETEPQAWGRIYLKTTEGDYIPLFQREPLQEQPDQ